MIAIEQVAFLEILLFIVGALLFVGIGTRINTWLTPQRTNKERRCTYESGEEAIGNVWGNFNTRFYGISIAFILFEVETVLLFPWATVWAKRELNDATGGLWAYYTAISATLFFILFTVGLVYVWSQGHLAGTLPPSPSLSASSHIPKTFYDRVNNRYASTPSKKQEKIFTHNISPTP